MISLWNARDQNKNHFSQAFGKQSDTDLHTVWLACYVKKGTK